MIILAALVRRPLYYPYARSIDYLSKIWFYIYKTMIDWRVLILKSRIENENLDEENHG